MNNLSDLACNHARQNQLLAALPEPDWRRLQPLLEPTELRAGQVLFESGSTPASLIFPTTAVVSLLYLTREGASTEVGVVGNDGVVGIALFMGGHATPSRAVVQGAGRAYRLHAQALQPEVARPGAVFHALLRYTQALIAQVAQTAACNRYHSIDQQLCRRLLVGLDHSPTDELVMTHELASSLLGVRREGVTAAANKLRQSGAIRYRRGRIAVLDRQQLESRSCECYAKARNETHRLLLRPMPLPQAA